MTLWYPGPISIHGAVFLDLYKAKSEAVPVNTRPPEWKQLLKRASGKKGRWISYVLSRRKGQCKGTARYLD